MKNTVSEQLQLIFSNSSLREANITQYEVEVDLSINNKEQSHFLNKQEILVPVEKIITIVFQNPILPCANMVSISHQNNRVKYQLSIFLTFNEWPHDQPLRQFVPLLVSNLEQTDINLEVEGRDLHGFYLLATIEVPAKFTIQQRINALSRQLAECLKC